MSKHGGFLTPKAISVRQKARGLQRLRWYCEMCRKQCRDENGFKCHTASESHLRQMQLFAQDADSFIDDFSQRLVDGYLEVLSRQGGRRVKANHVYQSYIADKQHVHMNATKWDALSSFVSYLGKSGLAAVDQDDNGEYYVKFIDRDPRVVARQQELARKAARQKSAEDDDRRRIELEVEEATRRAESRQRAESAEQKQDREEQQLQRRERGTEDQAGGKLPISLSLVASTDGDGRLSRPNAFAVMEAATEKVSAVDGRKDGREKRKMSQMEAIIVEEERQRRLRLLSPASSDSAAPSSSAPWLLPGLVVKLLSRHVHGDELYRLKGVVTAVAAGGYTANVHFTPGLNPSSSLSAAVQVSVEQSELETVIPALGHPVLLLRGACRGQRAVLLALSDDQSSCTVRCDDGRTLDGLELDDVCKLSSQL